MKNICLVAPENLLPHQKFENIQCYSNIKEGVKNADVVITLRVRKSRMQYFLVESLESYYKKYSLTSEVLKLASPDAIVLHPGPINAQGEITKQIVQSKQSAILKQITNGIVTKMAILEYITGQLSC